MTKDVEKTIVPIFGIKANIDLFTVRFPRSKLYKASELAIAELNKQSIMLLEAESLINFLFFYANMVHLGWIFMHYV